MNDETQVPLHRTTNAKSVGFAYTMTSEASLFAAMTFSRKRALPIGSELSNHWQDN